MSTTDYQPTRYNLVMTATLHGGACDELDTTIELMRGVIDVGYMRNGSMRVVSTGLTDNRDYIVERNKFDLKKDSGTEVASKLTSEELERIQETMVYAPALFDDYRVVTLERSADVYLLNDTWRKITITTKVVKRQIFK